MLYYEVLSALQGHFGNSVSCSRPHKRLKLTQYYSVLFEDAFTKLLKSYLMNCMQVVAPLVFN